MSAILVVGASGPLGRAVVAELGAAGHAVTGASRSGAAGSERVDVTDIRAAAALVGRAEPEAVVYLARPDLGPSGGDAEIERAVDSLARFAQHCAEAGVRRFVFASSAAVYGTAADRPLREDDPVVTDAPYAALKVLSERALERVGGSSGLAPVSLRVFNVWGPGFNDSLVNRLVLGHDPVIYDTDRYVRDYIHSSDVARGFRLALEDGGADALTLNLGTGLGTSNRSLVALCPDAAHRAHPASDVESFSVADVSRIASRWGFEARVALSGALLSPDNFR